MNQVLTKDISRIALIDILILGLVIFIPSLSHLLPFPMYFLDPMRLMLLASYILSKNPTNSYVLAFVIPLISYFITGHPVLPKALLISAELVVNISLFIILIKNFGDQIFLTMFVSIIFSKVIYYILKFSLLNMGVLDGSLFSTSLVIQFIIGIFVTIVFTYFYKKDKS